MVVVGEVAAGRVDLAGVPEQPVVPDAGGEGEQALADACPDAFGTWPPWSSSESWPLSESLIELDPLAHTAELAEPFGFVFAVGADELRVERTR